MRSGVRSDTAGDYKFFALALLGTLLALAIPILLSRILSIYALYLLSLIEVFGIVATGLTLLMGYAGQLSIGHAAFFGTGAYAAAYLGRQNWELLPALAAGGALSAALGVAIGVVALRLRGFYLAVITLSVGLVASQVFSNADSLTGGVSGFGHMAPAKIFSMRVGAPADYFVVISIFLIFIMFASWLISRSPAGRAMRAVAVNELAAQSIGIDTFKLKVAVFALSAGYAGLAGGLYANLVHFISPDHFGFAASVQFLTMTIVGGLRNIAGGLAGAALVVFASEELRAFPRWQPILFGSALMLISMVAPDGFLGAVVSLRRWVPRWRRR